VGEPARRKNFATTRWSVVLAAGGTTGPDARAAMSALCAAYYEPLYGYVRRQGNDATAARDLTQSFFATLLEKQVVAEADPDRGRFRSFLLGALKHFLANQRDAEQAKKRGGGQAAVPIDGEEAEKTYARALAHGLTPEREYARRWALVLLDRVLATLKREQADAGKAEAFERLAAFLPGGDDDAPYAEVALALGSSAGAVKVAVHRLRKRYAQLLRAEILETVGTSGDVDEEIKSLFEALT
jgi:RNA polymerase sigma factor (sigma-70 family)